MTTFFFHITVDGHFSEDIWGTCLQDACAAWKEATKIAAELTFDEFPGLASSRQFHLRVVDQVGKSVGSIDLAYDPSAKQ